MLCWLKRTDTPRNVPGARARTHWPCSVELSAPNSACSRCPACHQHIPCIIMSRVSPTRTTCHHVPCVDTSRVSSARPAYYRRVWCTINTCGHVSPSCKKPTEQKEQKMRCPAFLGGVVPPRGWQPRVPSEPRAASSSFPGFPLAIQILQPALVPQRPRGTPPGHRPPALIKGGGPGGPHH